MSITIDNFKSEPSWLTKGLFLWRGGERKDETRALTIGGLFQQNKVAGEGSGRPGGPLHRNRGEMQEQEREIGKKGEPTRAPLP